MEIVVPEPTSGALDRTHGRAVVKVLACVLEKLVAANNRNGPDTYTITKFHALRPPGIGVCDYLERIHKYASCSGECFVLALVYIDRLIQRKNFVINSLNVHRIIITSVMLAAKFFDDQYFNNAYYAKVGGVPCNEMNSLELEFLFLVNFSLHVTPEVYSKYQHELTNHLNEPMPIGGSAMQQQTIESQAHPTQPTMAQQPPGAPQNGFQSMQIQHQQHQHQQQQQQPNSAHNPFQPQPGVYGFVQNQHRSDHGMQQHQQEQQEQQYLQQQQHHQQQQQVMSSTAAGYDTVDCSPTPMQTDQQSDGIQKPHSANAQCAVNT